MLEKLENNFENEKNGKYPIDPIESLIESQEIELQFKNKEIREIFKVCEDDYGDLVDWIKKSVKKENFKKVIFTPFNKNFHVFPTEKNNSCFMPAESIPRLNNLIKIVPEIGKNGIKGIIMHEKQHCLSSALEGHKKELSVIEYEKKLNTSVRFIECQTDLQRIIRETSDNDFNIEEVVPSISRYCLCLFILSGGGLKVLKTDYMKRGAIKWFENRYAFLNDDCKDLFIKEFEDCKDEVIEKYDKYIEENKVDDFYENEDEECKELRVKIIKRLNEMV